MSSIDQNFLVTPASIAGVQRLSASSPIPTTALDVHLCKESMESFAYLVGVLAALRVSTHRCFSVSLALIRVFIRPEAASFD